MPSDINKALGLARRLKAGSVWISMYGKMFPKGETETFKQSGKEVTLRGMEALNTFTKVTDILINIGQS